MRDNESKCFTKGQGIYPRSRASSLSEANRAIAALQAKITELTAENKQLDTSLRIALSAQGANGFKLALKEGE